MSNPIDLDLDDLSPSSKTIRLGGKPITIQIPNVLDLMKLFKIGMDLKDLKDVQGLDDEDKREADMKALDYFDDLKTSLYDLVPELKGVALNISQMVTLIKFLSTQAVPAEKKALEEKGITPIEIDDNKKKVILDS